MVSKMVMGTTANGDEGGPNHYAAAGFSRVCGGRSVSPDRKLGPKGLRNDEDIAWVVQRRLPVPAIEALILWDVQKQIHRLILSRGGCVGAAGNAADYVSRAGAGREHGECERGVHKGDAPSGADPGANYFTLQFRCPLR